MDQLEIDAIFQENGYDSELEYEYHRDLLHFKNNKELIDEHVGIVEKDALIEDMIEYNEQVDYFMDKYAEFIKRDNLILTKYEI